jgi:replicative DNA helicase
MRALPANPDAELAVLGSLIKHPETRHLINVLNPDCFYAPENRRAFEIIAEAIRAGGRVDAETLGPIFAHDGELQRLLRLRRGGAS